MKTHYTALPLDENEDFDLAKFNNEQLSDFYWDHPESLSDEMMGL